MSDGAESPGTALRVALLGTAEIYSAAQLLAHAGATVAVIDLTPDWGYEEEFDEEDVNEQVSVDTPSSEFAVIDRIGDQAPVESWLDHGAGPLRRALRASLGGSPTTVIVGDVLALAVDVARDMRLIDPALEVIVLGADARLLDETLRRLFYQRPAVAASGLAIGGLRVPDVPGRSVQDPGPTARMLIDRGFGRHASLDGLDRLARRRRRKLDALAGRVWRYRGGTDVRGGCLVADAAVVSSALSHALLDDWGSVLVDLGRQGVDAVLVPMDSGEGAFEVLGPGVGRTPYASEY